jgi:hypothetical protein
MRPGGGFVLLALCVAPAGCGNALSIDGSHDLSLTGEGDLSVGGERDLSVGSERDLSVGGERDLAVQVDFPDMAAADLRVSYSSAPYPTASISCPSDAGVCHYCCCLFSAPYCVCYDTDMTRGGFQCENCDGPEDCPSGVCCLGRCSADGTCSSQVSCHFATDCPASTPYCCAINFAKQRLCYSDQDRPHGFPDPCL